MIEILFFLYYFIFFSKSHIADIINVPIKKSEKNSKKYTPSFVIALSAIDT